MNTLSCVAMQLWLPGPGLPHCEELFPSLPSPCPGTPELCSSLLLWHAAVSFSSLESSPKWTTVAISKQSFFFFFLIQCLGVQIMFMIVAKIMEWKVGLLPKKRRKIYLTKLKWFRPSLRFLKLGPPKVLCPSSLPGVGSCSWDPTRVAWHTAMAPGGLENHCYSGILLASALCVRDRQLSGLLTPSLAPSQWKRGAHGDSKWV